MIFCPTITRSCPDEILLDIIRTRRNLTLEIVNWHHAQNRSDNLRLLSYFIYVWHNYTIINNSNYNHGSWPVGRLNTDNVPNLTWPSLVPHCTSSSTYWSNQHWLATRLLWTQLVLSLPASHWLHWVSPSYHSQLGSRYFRTLIFDLQNRIMNNFHLKLYSYLTFHFPRASNAPYLTVQCPGRIWSS